MQLGGYGAFFAVPHVRQLAFAMLFARLPMGVTTIVLVLFVSSVYGASASGFATAAFTGGLAIFSPVFGRLVDAGKGPACLRMLAVIDLAAIVVFVLMVNAHVPVVLVVAVAFVCGACIPPIAGTTRSLWPFMLEMHLVSTAYNFEILLIDIIYVAGPLVASVFIGLGQPALCLIITNVAACAGALLLAKIEPVHACAQRNRKRTLERQRAKELHEDVQAGKVSLDALGAAGDDLTAHVKPPLFTFAVVLVLTATLAKFAFSGWAETLMPLYFSEMGNPFLGSVVVSAWSVGAALGVIAFNRFQPSSRTISIPNQMALFAAVFLGATLLIPFGTSFAAMCVILFFVGFAGAPGDNIEYQLAGMLAPEERQAEMFSWLNTATSVGVAFGAFMAGVTVDAMGAANTLALPSTCSVIFVFFSIVLALHVHAKKHA